MRSGDGLIYSSLDSLFKVRQQLHALYLAKRHIRARYAGQYRSLFKGRGMDFAESRPYQPGDDIRSIDWRVTARTGKAHTKLFQEERERPIMVWVDLRADMFFATRGRFKSVLAAEVAALLMWKALEDSDRVGGFIQEAEYCTEMRPMRNRAAVLNLMRQLAQATETQPTLLQPGQSQVQQVLQQSWTRLRRVANQGTHSFIISDFRHVTPAAWQQLAMMNRSAAITLVAIHDPFESELPNTKRGRLRLTDGRRSLWMSLRPERKRLWQQQADRQQQQIKDFARRHHIPLISLSTQMNQRERLLQLARGLR